MDDFATQKNRRLGRQIAFTLPRHSVLSGHVFRWPGRFESVLLAFMKKPSRREQHGEPSRRSPRDCRKDGGKEGRWAFSLASENLFALGWTAQARRVAYRTVDGELRFLPL